MRIGIVIPANNEAATIEFVLNEIAGSVGNLVEKVVVVDDGSTDETGALAKKKGAEVLSAPFNMGAWLATQTGMRRLLSLGFDCVISFDADGQHVADSIKSLILAFETQKGNIVIGASLSRATALRSLAWRLLRLSSGLAIGDVTSGLRLYDGRAMKLLTSKEASYFKYQDIGILTLALSQGLVITEVEVPMRPRKSGGSRVFKSWIQICSFMISAVLLGIAKRKAPNGTRQRNLQS